MKRLTVLLTVLLSVAALVSTISCAKSQEPPPQPPAKPSLPPELFLDTDGDGFNDWFETNIAHYDPNVSNARYVILFDWFDDRPNSGEIITESTSNFFIREGVPPENIFSLTSEEATIAELERAINQVAKRANENDVVFFYLSTHGYVVASFSADKENPAGDIVKSCQMIDQLLDQINAMVVVAAISFCGKELILPITKEGTCPRTVCLGGDSFLRTLGRNNEHGLFIEADTDYGNGDGYLSVGEIGHYLVESPKWRVEEGTDTSNIAHQIYLTDHTPYHIPPILITSQNKSS